MNMKSSCIQLNDLSDELLLIIFKNLNNTSLLYSLMGMNKRLDQILHDYTFTNILTLMEYFSFYRISSLSNRVIDRFCLYILPSIEHNIKWFHLEASSMERILLSGNYSNLFGLGIYNITKEDALHYFTDQTSLSHIFKNQITSLVVKTMFKEYFSYDLNALIFTNIIIMFSNLKCLTYDPSDSYCQVISFENLPPTVFSTTLLELCIKVRDVKDCLHLLDGRFNQLRVFDVKIQGVFSSISKISEDKLLNLRYFSLSCLSRIFFYDTIVVPLLHRMSNLEQLRLYFDCHRKQSFIDGNDLKKNILIHLPRLKTFKFNICSFIDCYNQINLLSNDDIRNTFREFSNNKIISCIDYFVNENKGQCHIYSYPFTLTSYDRITNNFPGGLFPYVRKVSLFDEQPFEHEFFIRIQKSFPYMEDLTVTNWKSQNNKQDGKSKNDNRDLSLIHYHHLTCLNLTEAHDDYVEQFLLDTKTALPFNLSLSVNYYSIRRITHNFKRIETRINCSKINCVYMDNIRHSSKDFRNYFLDIEYM